MNMGAFAVLYSNQAKSRRHNLYGHIFYEFDPPICQNIFFWETYQTHFHNLYDVN